MKRFKGTLFGLLTFLTVMNAGAAGSWRMHPSFSDRVTRVAETPEFVYMLARTLPESDIETTYTLFRYDKEGDELQGLSTDDGLAYTTVSTFQYNPAKKYLAVVYANYDIDLLYDNGEIKNIPTYRLAQMSAPKKVNSITVDPDNNRLYLATEFGYVALNDKKGEIAESRNYGSPLKSVARIGEDIFIINDGRLLKAPAGDVRMNITDYKETGDFDTPSALYPLGGSKGLLITAGGSPSAMWMVDNSEANPLFTQLGKSNYYNFENTKSGVSVPTSTNYVAITQNGISNRVSVPEDERSRAMGSYNLTEFWQGADRKGLKSGKKDGNNWIVTRDYMLPDAPAPFLSGSMAMHPSKGMLVAGFGHDVRFNSYGHTTPAILSGHSNGRWAQYSPGYFNSDYSEVLTAPLGVAVDPDNSDYVYMTSRKDGIMRLNLNDPEDILMLSSASAQASKLKGFVDFVPVQKGEYAGTTHFSAPHFDYYGNLWTTHADYDNQSTPTISLYCWTSADRKATTGPQNVSLPVKVEVKGYPVSNQEEVVPMKTQGRRNILVYKYGRYDDYLVIIDTNGTPTDASDDKVADLKNVYDQDGNTIDVHYIRAIFEDPATGNVWIGHSGGVFYFNPADILAGKKTVYRIKVARNDGTNLADYLLNEVNVNAILADGSGRKWFGTAGGGLICTTSDGREILEELNTSVCDIPSDVVYSLGYDSSVNSLMVSTDNGIAEYFLSGEGGGKTSEDVKAWPNPVRPGYLGYVTIEGVPAGAVVKIADSAGNVIKELGRESGNTVQWDVTNATFKRVASGVYYILASPAEDSDAGAAIGKILVVN